MEIGPCPEISVLSSLLDGELAGGEGARVRSHLESCPACAGRVRYMEAGDNLLFRHLGNSKVSSEYSRNRGCVSPETMTSYLHDLLSVEEKTRVERHLDICDACLRELTSLAKMEVQLRQSSAEPLPNPLRKKVEGLWKEEESKKERISHVIGLLVTDSIEFVRALLSRPSLSFGGVLAAVMAGLLLFIWWGPFRAVKEPSPSVPSSTAGPSEKHDLQAPGMTEGGGEVASARPSIETETKSSREPSSGTAISSGPMVASKPGDKLEEPGASIAAGRQQPGTEAKPGRRLIGQDFRDVGVEAGPLQVAGGEAILLLKIFNKTEEDLGIMLAESPPLLTDKSGTNHRPKTFTGIKAGPYASQNWTYIAPHGEHTISLNFDQKDLSLRRDSIFSISLGIILARRDEVEKAKAGSRPARAETLKIALSGIGTQ